MNLADVILCVCIIPPVLFGFWRGLLWQIGLLVGLVAGVLAAATLGPVVCDVLLPEAVWASLLGHLAVFVSVFLLVQLFRWLLHRGLVWLRLRWLDHLSGGVVAALTGALAGAWVIASVGFFAPEWMQTHKEDSYFGESAELLACETGFPCDEEWEISFDAIGLERMDPRRLLPFLGSMLEELQIESGEPDDEENQEADEG